MAMVLTLISEPMRRAVDDVAVDLACAALAEAGAKAGPPRMLAEGAACDIPFETNGPDDVAEAVRQRLAGRPVDVAIQPGEGRRKRILVADMESTLIENELVDDLAAIADPSGHLARTVSAVTARSMRGEVDFASSLRQRAILLRGQPEECLARAAAGIRLKAGAETLIRTMAKFGAFTAIVTGGFAPFTEIVRGRLGADLAVGNRLIVKDGKLTGALEEPILDRDGKAQALLRIAAERGATAGDVLAVGDGANDLRMIEAAGTGVAFRAKPVLRDAAKFRIDHGDLTALLYLQGYRSADFAANIPMP